MKFSQIIFYTKGNYNKKYRNVLFVFHEILLEGQDTYFLTISNGQQHMYLTAQVFRGANEHGVNLRLVDNNISSVVIFMFISVF